MTKPSIQDQPLASDKPDKLSLTYNPGMLLAVTIQPDDHLQFFEDAKVSEPKSYKRYDHFRKRYKHLLDPLIYDKISYYLVCELSEPIGSISTKGPRLHLHGMIYLKERISVFKWLLNHLPRLLDNARVEVSVVHDPVAWVNYIKKQSQYWPGKKANPVFSSTVDLTFFLTDLPLKDDHRETLGLN